MYPILFSIGALHIFSLSVFLVLAWSTWSFLFWRYTRSYSMDEDRVFTLMFWATLTAFVAARAGFVITHWYVFSDNVLKTIALWVQPGLSFYSGFVAGLVMLFWLSRHRGIRVAHILDGLAVSLPWALILGNVGSFLDGSEIGKPTGVPWAVHFVGHPGGRHPVQMYEIAVLLAVGIATVFLGRLAAKRRWPYGIVGVWFFLLFAPATFGVEFFKESSVYWRGVSANQWILLALFAEAFGAFYVRGGGREKFVPFVRKLYAKLPFRRS